MEPQFTSQTPNVVMVDDFFDQPLDVRSFALSQSYVEEPAYHKVRRSAPFRWAGIKERFEQLLGVRITQWEEYGYNGCFQYGIGGDQIVYHADEQTYAAIIYLVPDAPPCSGTNLYRSKATGLRLVNEATARSKGMTLRQAEERTFSKKLLDPTAWELVDSFGNVFNRCLIWNARLLHAVSNYFGTGLHDARLSQIFFFDAEPRVTAVPGNPLTQVMAATIAPEQLMTPEQLVRAADHLCNLLGNLTPEQRKSALQMIHNDNPVLHSVVVTQLKQAPDHG